MSAARTIEPEKGPDAAPEHQQAKAAAEERLNQAARQALQGNRSALKQFIQTVTPEVRRICRTIMGRDHAELEDAIQECVLDIARALPQFRFEADVSHYVTKIATRRAISLQQRSRARLQRYAPMGANVSPVMTFDQGLEHHANLVRRLLDDLGEPQSTVLRLRLMLGHSIEEIASITGAPENTVKKRLRLGKSYIRRQLERSGEVPRAR
jgi:RNA polymerase sigma factor (sigma-70 family)